jgi:hypothetical protein
MHLAERSLFNVAARLLHTFDIKPGLDNDGNEVMPDLEDYQSSIISAPAPFKVRLKVRSAAMNELLDKEWSQIAAKGDFDSWYG